MRARGTGRPCGGLTTGGLEIGDWLPRLSEVCAKAEEARRSCGEIVMVGPSPDYEAFHRTQFVIAGLGHRLRENS